MKRKRTWSTVRKVTKEEHARIERVRKELQGLYGCWQRISAETDFHYNSLMRFANGLTMRPSKHLLTSIEAALKKKDWRVEAPRG